MSECQPCACSSSYSRSRQRAVLPIARPADRCQHLVLQIARQADRSRQQVFRLIGRPTDQFPQQIAPAIVRWLLIPETVRYSLAARQIVPTLQLNLG